MCRLLTILMLVHLAGISLHADNGDRDASDLACLQGVWDCAPPGPTPDSPLVKMKIFGNGIQYLDAKNQTIVATNGESISATFTIDETKSPKHIDVTWVSRDYSDNFKAIYMLDGDHLIMISALPGEARPNVFKAHYGTGKELLAFRRNKSKPHTPKKTVAHGERSGRTR